MLTSCFCCFTQVEKLARTLFLWKIEVHEQKEKVYEMRRWNEALVTNMLPEHVARHFLGAKKRDEVKSSHPRSLHGFDYKQERSCLGFGRELLKFKLKLRLYMGSDFYLSCLRVGEC